MSKLRSLNTVIWSDTWFELLEPSAKLLFIYLVTNEKTNMLGVYEISIRKVSFETGIPEKNITKYLEEFESKNKIKYSENRVLLLNFLKHQNYNFNMMKSAIRTYNDLPNSLKVEGLNKIEESKQGFETLCNGFGGVRKIEYEYEEEREEESESEYDVKKSILDSQSWCEQIFMKRKINLDRGLIYLNTFLDTQEDLVGEGEGLNRSEHKIKNHFVKWLDLEMKKPVVNKSKKPTDNLAF